ncbi:DEAD/DEAH box helicase [Rossellomorea aquimaris]|uniref:DEAD/DEAH box helicase n=1 Tax=Rossellomorea aquimaris TaxID=189382 RepID=A0A5D4UAP7_9BACI|nr:DEAD/DEAH box helicase [Rossellomorea aquimaris]TYS78720.1 DEAD/DEAH box helicase [Rossellomorea aquimaris]TYS84467.1 DEAD/DEAH box helicase [Rossellomorea aquimaris]
MNSFASLGLSKSLQKTLSTNGISEPTLIQENVIPTLLEGKDVMAKAQTGTGKTFAYVLPILEKSKSATPHIQSLIITPTRELAIQVTSEIRKLTTKNKGFSVISVYGGKSHEEEIKELEQNVNVVVGTPGRLLDHLKKGNLDLSHLMFLVIDEADQLLQIGFLNKVEEILSKTPANRQTMLFSATIPAEIKKLGRKYMKTPQYIEVADAEKSTSINQFAIYTVDRAKQDTVIQLIEAFQPSKSIVFCRTKRRVTKLYQVLKSKGFKVAELHGDIPQEKREIVMEQFRTGDVPMLVATDVASRGLDIEGVTHVFNYDMPENAETYIHRIGRTGRAGETGLAYTLYSSEERSLLDGIEAELNSRIQKQNLGNTISLKSKTTAKKKGVKRQGNRNRKERESLTRKKDEIRDKEITSKKSSNSLKQKPSTHSEGTATETKPDITGRRTGKKPSSRSYNRKNKR